MEKVQTHFLLLLLWLLTLFRNPEISSWLNYSLIKQKKHSIIWIGILWWEWSMTSECYVSLSHFSIGLSQEASKLRPFRDSSSVNVICIYCFCIIKEAFTTTQENQCIKISHVHKDITCTLHNCNSRRKQYCGNHYQQSTDVSEQQQCSLYPYFWPYSVFYHTLCFFCKTLRKIWRAKETLVLPSSGKSYLPARMH